MRRLIFGLTLLAILSPALACAQMKSGSAPERIDTALQRKIENAAQNFQGDVGIYVRHLSTGRTASLHDSELFPTASLVKVPILLAMFQKIEDGEIAYDSNLVYRDSLLYPGEDIVGSFRDSARIHLSKVIMLMITTSDNTASLWCQRLAGTGTVINDWLEKHGFRQTRVNSRTPGREKDRELFGWGQTTPREMAELLVMVREGRAVSRAASEEMYRILTRIYWNGEALSQIPPWIQAASKQGAVDRSTGEIGRAHV